MIDLIRNFEEVFGVREITTQKMKDAVRDWNNLYYASEPTEVEDPCLRLPVEVVKKIQKAVFPEYEASATGKNEDFVNAVIAALNKKRKSAVQKALISGEVLLKPLLPRGTRGWVFVVIPRLNYIVLGRDADDTITDIGTSEQTIVNGTYYTFFERRVISNGHLVIYSKLFFSESANTLGSETHLGALEKYANIPPELHLYNVHSLGLVYMACPSENVVDESPDGVSVYAAASRLIHQANINEMQFSGEFERGKSRIFASEDLFRRDPITKKRRPLESVFVKTDTDPESGIDIFSPQLRHESYLARKNAYLYDIETQIGIKHGMISKAEAVEKTATEISSSAGDYSLTVIDFQEMWENAVKDAVLVCAELQQEYNPGTVSYIDPDKDISVSWGNGVLYDEDKTWDQYLSMVAAGLLKPELALAWYFDLPHETEQDLEAIRRDYMPQLEQITNEA